MNHLEGGWPQDVNPAKETSKKRQILKMENDARYIKAVVTLAEPLEKYVKQNCALDIYAESFQSSTFDYYSEVPAAKITAVLKDPHKEFNRTATHISWNPTDGKKLAVAYSMLRFQSTPDNLPTDSYIWDIANPNIPETKMVPSSPMCCIEYNPKESYTLVGGCYNGIVSLFDSRKPTGKPVIESDIKESHKDPVYDIKWFQNKNPSMFMSCSTDGQVLVWDSKNMSQPVETYEVVLTNEKVEGERLFRGIAGGEAMDYDISYSPTKFLLGTEQGYVVACSKRKNKGYQIDKAYFAHYGPIYSVQRNPFLSKYFLSIGDWTAKIWVDDLPSPIITTKYHSSYLTDGCWSNSRPGVFFTTKTDGTLDVWDLLYKQSTPLLTVNISGCALQTVRMYNGKYLAVGSQDGSTSLIELSEGLSGFRGEERVSSNEEKNTIQEMFDREVKREKMLEEQKKEILNQKKRKIDAAKAKEKSFQEVLTVDEKQLTDVTEYFESEVGEKKE